MKSIETADAQTVLERVKQNNYRKYPTPESDRQRLRPFAKPEMKSSFSISKSDNIFAIGSCFARNIEQRLTDFGFNVLSDARNETSFSNMNDVPTLFNKYTIKSIQNELDALLPNTHMNIEKFYYEFGKGSGFDFQLGAPKLAFDKQEYKEFRKTYSGIFRKLRKADVVILTLGYVELWYDTKRKLYTNVSPPANFLKRHATEFEFHVLGYEQVYEQLQQTWQTLQDICGKNVRMLLTVSPVPLRSTLRDMDVLVANSYSKSVQRAAAERFCVENHNVDYFPSYEFVSLSEPSASFTARDYRHITGDMVSLIMQHALKEYTDLEDIVAPTEQHVPEALVKARILQEKNEWEEQLELLSSIQNLVDNNADLLVMQANAYRGLNDFQNTFVTLRKARALAPNRPAILERMIRISTIIQTDLSTDDLLAQHKLAFAARHYDIKQFVENRRTE